MKNRFFTGVLCAFGLGIPLWGVIIYLTYIITK